MSAIASREACRRLSTDLDVLRQPLDTISGAANTT